MTAPTIPKAFIWRRVHSLMGLWLVLFLLEHLLTNSQAALLLGENGAGFVRMVNAIHDLPYLSALELFLIGTPIAIHAFWGIRYLFTAKSNSFKSDGSKPSLPQYKRNKAYTWQRITSWILVFGIIAHVAKFRFIEYPESVREGLDTYYFVKVSNDPGLYTLEPRLGFQIYDAEKISQQVKESEINNHAQASYENRYDFWQSSAPYNHDEEAYTQKMQENLFKQQWINALVKKKIIGNEIIAVSKSFGTATLLSVRDAFKSPVYVVLYTIFVLAACFHAFNGLWTFMISWGLILRRAAQKTMGTICVSIMLLIAFLGLAAIWGTYWINLKY
ncbi:MAG: succinate dehydrogenase [Chlamydiae bacterium]|nr:succinate dehydrogenase [Chlamydiota bacterium]